MIDIDSLLEDQAWHRSIRHCIIDNTYIHLLPAQQRPSGQKICANPAATSAWLSLKERSAVKEELDAPFLRKCSKCMMLSARTTDVGKNNNSTTCTKQNRRHTSYIILLLGTCYKQGPHPMRFGRELLQLCL